MICRYADMPSKRAPGPGRVEIESEEQLYEIYRHFDRDRSYSLDVRESLCLVAAPDDCGIVAPFPQLCQLLLFFPHELVYRVSPGMKSGLGTDFDRYCILHELYVVESYRIISIHFRVPNCSLPLRLHWRKTDRNPTCLLHVSFDWPRLMQLLAP